MDKNQSITVALNFKQQMKGNSHYVGAKDVQFVAGKSNLITADDKLTLQTGKTAIVLNKNGDITLVGRVIELKSSQHVVLRGARC